ncbi:MAG: PfkB family carbohydrate kinase [Chloroflexota bacterium]
MNAFSQIDYLVIGHISRDKVPGGYAPGGTAVYSALTARALGIRTAVVTSVDATYDLESFLTGIDVHRVPAPESTVFENVTEGRTRRQKVFSVAQTISADDIPLAWQRAPIVHLGPIVGEIGPKVIQHFSNSLVGLTPQGWFRRWGADGQVFAVEWPHAAVVFPLASAVILSVQDLPNRGYLDKLRRWSPLLVVTHGKRGCTVYSKDEERSFAAAEIQEVNSIGAGDIFATAFLIRLRQTNGNPWEAAGFANEVASCSVGEEDLSAKAQAIEALFQSQY